MNQSDTLEQRFYEGLCLAASGDFDGATAAFLDCLTAEPGRGEFVGEFLASLAKRTAGGVPVVVGPAPDAKEVERAASRQRWSEVFQAAPRRLAAHPDDI